MVIKMGKREFYNGTLITGKKLNNWIKNGEKNGAKNGVKNGGSVFCNKMAGVY